MISSVSSVQKSENSQSATPSEVDGGEGENGLDIGDFEGILGTSLKAYTGNNVSEEALFAAVVAQRITQLKGQEAGDKFNALLNAKRDEVRKPDGFVPEEEATLNALKQFVADGNLTAEEGNQVYSHSFAAAQLDDNKAALYDDRGGAGDPTVAMAALDVAIQTAKTMIGKLISGEETGSQVPLTDAKPNPRPGSGSDGIIIPGHGSANISFDAESITPQGEYIDGSEGYLFKPVSNNQGTLAVMLPAALTDHVLKVVLKDSNGDTVEEGVAMREGIAETGREKFSFSKAGQAYPKNLTVEITLADGTVKTISIPDPSKRYD